MDVGKFTKRIIFGKDPDKLERLHHVIIQAIRLVSLIAFAEATRTFRPALMLIIALNFLLTFAPRLFEKRYKVDIPIEFEIAIVLFIFASLFLGEVRGYYTKFWWWDVVLHTGAGVAIGFFGFMILYILYKANKFKARPITIAVFAFCFALAIGALWEIFEFSMDQFFALNMQKSGLVDTMWDLIIDSLGALLASAVGYFYLKRKDFPLFGNIMEKFEEDNPRLFKKK